MPADAGAPSPRGRQRRARAARQPPDWPTRARAARRRRAAARATARRLRRRGCSDAASCSSSVASVSSRPDGGFGQQPAPLAILERAAGVLEPARQRRGVLRRHRRQAVPPHLAARRCDRRRRPAELLDLLARSRRDPPARVRAPAARSSFGGALPAAARRSPRARPRWPTRTAAPAASSISTSAWNSAHARRTAASAVGASSGSGIATSASA